MGWLYAIARRPGFPDPNNQGAFDSAKFNDAAPAFHTASKACTRYNRGSGVGCARATLNATAAGGIRGVNASLPATAPPPTVARLEREQQSSRTGPRQMLRAEHHERETVGSGYLQRSRSR